MTSSEDESEAGDLASWLQELAFREAARIPCLVDYEDAAGCLPHEREGLTDP